MKTDTKALVICAGSGMAIHGMLSLINLLSIRALTQKSGWAGLLGPSKQDIATGIAVWFFIVFIGIIVNICIGGMYTWLTRSNMYGKRNTLIGAALAAGIGHGTAKIVEIILSYVFSMLTKQTASMSQDTAILLGTLLALILTSLFVAIIAGLAGSLGGWIVFSKVEKTGNSTIASPQIPRK